MVVIEIGIIYCIAVPLGLIVTIALEKSISIPVEFPVDNLQYFLLVIDSFLHLWFASGT